MRQPYSEIMAMTLRDLSTHFLFAARWLGRETMGEARAKEQADA